MDSIRLNRNSRFHHLNSNFESFISVLILIKKLASLMGFELQIAILLIVLGRWDVAEVKVEK